MPALPPGKPAWNPVSAIAISGAAFSLWSSKPPLGSVWQLLTRSVLVDDEEWYGRKHSDGAKVAQQNSIRVVELGRCIETDCGGDADGDGVERDD
jgi:hypothetical protein